MFENLIESSPDRMGRSRSAFLVSFAVHLVIISMMVLIPLIYYDVLPQQEHSLWIGQYYYWLPVESRSFL